MRADRSWRWQLVVVASWATLICTIALPALADFKSLAPGWRQWRWATAPDVNRVASKAVRSDGYLIVKNVGSSVYPDGYLHLIPPWGGEIGADNRLGSELPLGPGFMLRRNYLYALRPSESPEGQITWDRTVIDQIDQWTGEVVKTTPYPSPYPTPAVVSASLDPLNDNLLFVESPTNIYSNEPDRIVDWDPDTGVKTPFWTSKEPAFGAKSVEMSSDGSILFVGGCDRQQPSNPTDCYIKAFDRKENLLYAIPIAGSDAFSIIYFDKGCFAGTLMYQTTHNQVIWAVHNPSATSTQSVPIASPPYVEPPPGEGGYYLGGGHVPLVNGRYPVFSQGRYAIVLSNSQATPACPLFEPPYPPGYVPPPKAVAAPPVRPAGPAPHPAPAIHVQTAPAPQAQAAAAPKAITQVSYQANTQAAAQGAAAPNTVGLADVTNDEPALSFSASALRVDPAGGWARLGWGAFAVAFMAGAAFALTEPRSFSLALIKKRLLL